MDFIWKKKILIYSVFILSLCFVIFCIISIIGIVQVNNSIKIFNKEFEKAITDKRFVGIKDVISIRDRFIFKKSCESKQKDMKFLIPIPDSVMTKKIETSLENRTLNSIKNSNFSDFTNLIACADINAIKYGQKILNISKITKIGFFWKGKSTYKSFLELTKIISSLFDLRINTIVYIKLNNNVEIKTFMVELNNKDKPGKFEETIFNFKADDNLKNYTAVYYITFILFLCQVDTSDIILFPKNKSSQTHRISQMCNSNFPIIKPNINIDDHSANHLLDADTNKLQRKSNIFNNNATSKDEDLRSDVTSSTSISYDLSTPDSKVIDHTKNISLEIDNPPDLMIPQASSETTSSLNKAEESCMISNVVPKKSPYPANSSENNEVIRNTAGKNSLSTNISNSDDLQSIIIAEPESSYHDSSANIIHTANYRTSPAKIEIPLGKVDSCLPTDYVHPITTLQQEILDKNAIISIENISEENLPESVYPEKAAIVSTSINPQKKQKLVSTPRISLGISSLNSREKFVKHRDLPIKPKNLSLIYSCDTIRSIKSGPNEYTALQSHIDIESNSNSSDNQAQDLVSFNNPNNIFERENNTLPVPIEKMFFSKKDAQLSSKTIHTGVSQFMPRLDISQKEIDQTLLSNSFDEAHASNFPYSEVGGKSRPLYFDSKEIETSSSMLMNSHLSSSNTDPGLADTSLTYLDNQNHGLNLTTSLDTKYLQNISQDSILNSSIRSNSNSCSMPGAYYLNSGILGVRNKSSQHKNLDSINLVVNNSSEIVESKIIKSQYFTNKSICSDSKPEIVDLASEYPNLHNTSANIKFDSKNDATLEIFKLKSHGLRFGDRLLDNSDVVHNKETPTGYFENRNNTNCNDNSFFSQLYTEQDSLIEAILNSSADSEKEYVPEKLTEAKSFEKSNQKTDLKKNSPLDFKTHDYQKSTENPRTLSLTEMIKTPKHVSSDLILNNSVDYREKTPSYTSYGVINPKTINPDEVNEVELICEPNNLVEGTPALSGAHHGNQTNKEALLDKKSELQDAIEVNLNESDIIDVSLNTSSVDSSPEYFNSYSSFLSESEDLINHPREYPNRNLSTIMEAENESSND